MRNFFHFQDGFAICSRNVIIASPPDALKDIEITSTSESNGKMYNVLQEHLFMTHTCKIHLIYDSAWWNHITNKTKLHWISDTPIRELHLYEMISHDQNDVTLPVAVLTLDAKHKSYWTGLNNRGQPSLLPNNDGLELSQLFHIHIRMHLCRILLLTNCSIIQTPLSYYVHDHKESGDLFAESSYSWTAGKNFEDAVRLLRKPFENEKFFMVGSWYDYPEYQNDVINGHLHSVDEAMKNYKQQLEP